jgi:hypothetical protein
MNDQSPINTAEELPFKESPIYVKIEELTHVITLHRDLASIRYRRADKAITAIQQLYGFNRINNDEAIRLLEAELARLPDLDEAGF